MVAFCCHGTEFWSILPQNLMQPFPHPIKIGQLASEIYKFKRVKFSSLKRRFLAFYCFKCYLVSVYRSKLRFEPISCPLNTLKKTKLTRNGWGKKVSFLTWESKSDRSLIIVNKSIRETENLDFFTVRSNFISFMNTKTCIFTRGYRHSWKYCIWCLFGETKFILYLFTKSFDMLQVKLAFSLISRNCTLRVRGKQKVSGFFSR